MKSSPAKHIGGYTMFELVVVLAIITAISGVILFSFTGLNEGAALNRSVREIALAMRKAQNMSLAVSFISTQSGPEIPQIVGVRISLTDPQRYFLFVDRNKDGKWVEADDAKIGSAFEVFERGIRVTALECANSSPPPSFLPCPADLRTVHVLFTAPEASLILTDGNGVNIGETINIRFGRPNGPETKAVTIRTSGQISIK